MDLMLVLTVIVKAGQFITDTFQDRMSHTKTRLTRLMVITLTFTVFNLILNEPFTYRIGYKTQSDENVSFHHSCFVIFTETEK